jgi:lactoylglutathione lyase
MPVVQCMVSSRFTHISVLAHDLDESSQFYAEIFGMEPIPAPNFSVPVRWLRCGDLQLHLFKRDIEAASYYHFGLHVDDFESVYESVTEGDVATFDMVGGEGEEVLNQALDVYELPDGSVQMYLLDPAGNLVEVNYPDVNDLDRSVVSETVDRDDLIPQDGEAADAVLYHQELLDDI